MQVTYDSSTDTLTLIFSAQPVHESDEDKPGVILDYGAAGEIVSMEILDASTRMEDVTSMQFRVLPDAMHPHA